MVTFLSGGLCWLFFSGVVSWVFGLAIFRPLYERTILFEVNHRYRISDILVLAAHIQVVAALIFAAFPSASAGERGVLVFSVSLLWCFWWFNGVRMLARAGVEYTWHRWLFLGIVLPAGYLSALLLVPATICIPFAVILMIGSLMETPASGFAAPLAVVLGAIAILGVTYLCHQVSQKIAERARADRAKSDGVHFQHLRQFHEAVATKPDLTGVWLLDSPKDLDDTATGVDADDGPSQPDTPSEKDAIWWEDS